MQAMLLKILSAVGGTLTSMALSLLLNEAFIRKIVLYLLEKLAAKTESEIDDKVLQLAKEAWNESAPKAP